jgi:hypothetical protein
VEHPRRRPSSMSFWFLLKHLKAIIVTLRICLGAWINIHLQQQSFFTTHRQWVACCWSSFAKLLLAARIVQRRHKATVVGSATSNTKLITR